MSQHHVINLGSWYNTYKNLTNIDCYLIKGKIEQFKIKPKISLITPVYNTKPIWLEKCLISIMNQLYDNWEWCICDNGSTDSETKKVVESFSSRDFRVRFSSLEKNAGIAPGTNKALYTATGDYVGFLDSDDELTLHALYLIVDAINKNPEVKYIYTDEVMVDTNGICVQTFFKPDWSPDTLRSQGYTNHFSVFRAPEAQQLGVREGYAGSQDFDFTLRFTETLTRKEISHVPTVTYEWRQHPASNGASNENECINNAVRAVEEHLERTGRKGKVYIDWPWYRVKYDLPNPVPEVDIAIISMNKQGMLHKCLSTILAKTNYPNYNLYLCVPPKVKLEIENKYVAMVKSGKIKFVPRGEDESYNYSLFINRMSKACQAPLLCLMNDDIEPIVDDWLTEMVTLAVQPHIGAVGAKLLFPNMTIQHAGCVLGIGGVCAHLFKNQHYSYVGYHGRAKLINNFTMLTGACSVIRRDLFIEMGGYEEQLAVAFNDVDFCIRLVQAGYINVYNPHALLIHYESATRGYDTTPEQQATFWKEDNFMKTKWKEYLKYDPFYNPNLSLESLTFDVTTQSRYKKPWLE